MTKVVTVDWRHATLGVSTVSGLRGSGTLKTASSVRDAKNRWGNRRILSSPPRKLDPADAGDESLFIRCHSDGRRVVVVVSGPLLPAVANHSDLWGPYTPGVARGARRAETVHRV
jgi:hypothetical protein